VSAEIPFIVLNELYVLDRPRLEDARADRRFALDPDAAKYFGWTVEQARAQPDSLRGRYSAICPRVERRHSLLVDDPASR
jgi:hypothetical protein